MALSVGEHICMDFDRYLKDLEQQGRCLFLPFKIQALNLKNIGKFSERKVEFGSNNNVISGHVGTGKTTIVKAIKYVSGSQELIKSEHSNGEIDLTMTDGRRLHLNVCEAGDVQCIVLDDAGEVLDSIHYDSFLRYLQDLNLQLILTSGRMNDELKEIFRRTFPDCRFIDLN